MSMLPKRLRAETRPSGVSVAPPNPCPDGLTDDVRLKVCTLAACPFPANHGTPGSIREMAEAVADRGHEVHIVTYHFGEDIPVCGPFLHRITPLTRESTIVVGPSRRRPLYDLQMIFKALEVIHQYRPHLIHAHGYEAALVAWVCRLLTGLPVVYSGHNTMGDELPTYNFIRPRWAAVALARMLDAVVPRLADRCVPHSANMKEFFQRMGLQARTDAVVPFGINLDRLARGDGHAVRARYGLAEAPVVLYAGVLDEFQRLDLLLGAMKLVSEQEPKAKLLIVVTIPNGKHVAALRGQIEALGIADRVVVTEPQPLDAIPEVLAACDVAVVPRPGAPGFPIKLLNYMAARRACVLFASSASTGLSHRQNAYLVSPDGSDALALGILDVLRDAGLRQRLGYNGYQFVRARHDRRLIARQICACYFRVLARAGRLSGTAQEALLPLSGSYTLAGPEPLRAQDESSLNGYRTETVSHASA
jgi:1,2-diacylglycerol 3-alpha-glucosyltransferase